MCLLVALVFGFGDELFGGCLLRVCWFGFGDLFAYVCLVIMSCVVVVNLILYVVRGVNFDCISFVAVVGIVFSWFAAGLVWW